MKPHQKAALVNINNKGGQEEETKKYREGKQTGVWK